MSGDAFLTEPAAGAGRAIQAGAQPPVLDQEFDSATLYALRAAVQAHVGQAELAEDRVGEVVLAVHELAANAIAHGAGHGRLRIWDLGSTLRCEIVDGGRTASTVSADAHGPADAHGSAAEADPWPAVNGHGLWLVRKVADELDLRSGPRGTRAVVTFLVRPGGAGR